MKNFVSCHHLLLSLTILLGSVVIINAFSPAVAPIRKSSRSSSNSLVVLFSNNDNDDADNAAPDDRATDKLKREFMALASITQRGFQANPSDRQKFKNLIASLEALNPTPEPAFPYYDTKATTDDDNNNKNKNTPAAPSLAGKWTLIYTDAPDITSLETATPTAKLGRIGQECDPLTKSIKNVIEWRRPQWAAALPFSGSDGSRILQKVCTKARASPMKPLEVDLEIAGIELGVPASGGGGTGDLWQDIQNDGLAVALLQARPVRLEGPLTAYFGRQTILYLDEDFRIIRTNQGYVAANVRDEEEWF